MDVGETNAASYCAGCTWKNHRPHWHTFTACNAACTLNTRNERHHVYPQLGQAGPLWVVVVVASMMTSHCRVYVSERRECAPQLWAPCPIYYCVGRWLPCPQSCTSDALVGRLMVQPFVSVLPTLAVTYTPLPDLWPTYTSAVSPHWQGIFVMSLPKVNTDLNWLSEIIELYPS